MNIIEALEDKQLLGQFLRDPSTWRAWLCFMRAFSALPPVVGDLSLFRACTGRTEWPTVPAAEVWIVAGRRSGKSYIVALLACYLAAFKKYRLSAGEVAHVLIVSPTKQQSGIIRKYISGFFSGNDFLRPMVARETGEGIELQSRVQITVLSGDFRVVRGYSAVAAIIDEVAFLQSDGANPDAEVLRALRPCLATTGGPLIAISSPYAKRGALYLAHRQHFGKDEDPVLVWQGTSTLMNPTLNVAAIDRAREEDPEGASAEWDAQFRSDVESFVSREAVESCVVPGRHELPPVGHFSYSAFVDPSGGSSDSFTMAVSHVEKDKRVLDVVRERRPPFSPEAIVAQYADLLKSYRVSAVTGDRYGAQWVQEQFRKAGIEYRPSEKTKSELYLELLPTLNSGQVELLDHERLLTQLCRLERRTARSGKDSVDHGPGGHDDVVNAAAGALTLARVVGPFLEDLDERMVDTGHVPLSVEEDLWPR